MNRLADRPGRRLGRRLGDERGATLALVAMMLTAMLTLTALVLDVGTAWGVRQQLVPATDAAALAAAQDLVHTPGDISGACNTAEAYLTANAPDSTMVDCDVVYHSGSGGRIVLNAAEETSGTFAEFGDDNELTVAGTSGAAWGAPTTVSELRPVGLCYDGNADLQAAIDSPPATSTQVLIPFTKDDPTDCGGAQSLGTFLSVDFGHDTDISTIKDWARDGHPGQVHYGPSAESSCEPGDCVERPYAIPRINSALWTLVASADSVPFPVYDFVDDDEVHLIGFVRARLIDFSFDPYQPLSSWWLKIDVAPGLVAGTCCGTSGIAAGNQVVALCAVDPDDQTACEPNTGSGNGGN